jgi:group I intron endonuclease
MKKQGIYCITNNVNGKKYVGSSVELDKRWKRHLSSLNRNVHKNAHLQASFNKHGIENFIFNVLEEIKSSEKLIEHEQYWMDTIKPEYNIRLVAANNLGLKHTEETKEKMRGANNYWFGKKPSEEVILKIKVANTGRVKTKEEIEKTNAHKIGKKLSEETKLKISLSNKGKIFSKKHCENIAKAKLGKKLSEEHKAKIAITSKISQTGKKLPEETKRKISESHKRYWLNKKAGNNNALSKQ